MSIQDTIETNYQGAFKGRDQATIDILRLLKSALKNASIELRRPLNDQDTLAVLGRELKRRQEAIQLYTQGGRPDLAAKEQSEALVIAKYLPEPLSDEELEVMARQVVAELGTGANFGALMKAVIGLANGRADGNRVSAVIKRLTAI